MWATADAYSSCRDRDMSTSVAGSIIALQRKEMARSDGNATRRASLDDVAAEAIDDAEPTGAASNFSNSQEAIMFKRSIAFSTFYLSRT